MKKSNSASKPVQKNMAIFPAKDLAVYRVYVPFDSACHEVKAEKMVVMEYGHQFTVGGEIVAHFPHNTISAIIKESK